MRCLAIYVWETRLELDFLYAALSKHLDKVSPSLKDVNIMIDGWPRARKISPDDLLNVLSQPDRLRSIEGKLTFSHDSNQDIGIFLISTTPSLFFLGLPESIEQTSCFEIFVKYLAEKIKLSYGYVFRSESDNPALYASGVTYVGAGKPIDQKTATEDERWFNVLVSGSNGQKKFINDGLMRGVYELNILNDQHVRRIINDEDLLSLINRKSWGSIKMVSSYNWLWHITGKTRADAENYLRCSSVLV